MSYLDTLHRIPDDIILAIAAQDFDEREGECCICGWAFREAVARRLNKPADGPYIARMADRRSIVSGCVEEFGGEYGDWYALFSDVVDRTPFVEDAFVDRLNEIVK